jgi:endoglucanase
MVREIRNLMFALLAVFLLTVTPSFAQPESLGARLAHLRHGVNLSGWFAQVYDKQGYTKEHFQSWTTPSDIALIGAMGFDHVRLGINPQPIFNSVRPDQISTEYLGRLTPRCRWSWTTISPSLSTFIPTTISRRK